MNRHEYRKNIIFAVYQSLLLGKEINEAFASNFNDDENDFLLTIRDDLIKNINQYKNEINSHLNHWTFERLSYIDQAILLVAYSEFKTNLNNKNIIIDEAIRIAKEYSNEDSYKYINGVLDNL